LLIALFITKLKSYRDALFDNVYLTKPYSMETRDAQLLAARPEIPNLKLINNTNSEEYFQNETIRPIAKMQNDLFVLVFKNYIRKHKNVFHNLNIDRKLEYIDNAVNRDIKFRNSLKGMLIGQFTTEEYKTYILNSSALNKRMMNIVKERLKNNMLEFEIADAKIG